MTSSPRLAIMVAATGALACASFRERPTSQVGTVLAVGQTAEFDGDLTITLREIVDDSRCPATYSCPLPGSVRLVFLAGLPDGSTKSIWIDTGYGSPEQPVTETAALRVNDVHPPRPPEGEVPIDDYRVAVEITPM